MHKYTLTNYNLKYVLINCSFECREVYIISLMFKGNVRFP